MRHSFRWSFTLFLMILSVGLASCASKEKNEAFPDEEVEVLYNRAARSLEAREYKKASDLFEEVERQYPYSKWSTQAQLMAAYASYQDLRYDEAVLALDRFIELHPGHKSIDYAYYLRAMCFYERISDVKRDQEITREALNAFDALIRRFPNSKYARDAVYKRDLTYDHIAAKEMLIGRYYLRKGHYNAAINRFKTVVDNYETTTHAAEALHRMVEAYLSLGITDQAIQVAAVLGHNFPGSEWYESTYRLLDPSEREKLLSERSWFKRTVEGFLDREDSTEQLNEPLGDNLPLIWSEINNAPPEDETKSETAPSDADDESEDGDDIDDLVIPPNDAGSEGDKEDFIIVPDEVEG